MTEKLPFHSPSLPPGSQPHTATPTTTTACIQTQTHVQFHTLSPFLVPSLPFTSSTSTGLSKWSQRIALWSNNPGGWHHRDGSVRGGEGTRKVREVEKVRKGKRETVAWRGSACVEIKMHREEPESKRVLQTWRSVRCSAWQLLNVYSAAPPLYLCIITKQKQMPG